MRKFSTDFIVLFQKRAAEGSIGPSAMRNQGNRHVVRQARKYLSSLDLSQFVTKSESQFRTALDHHTELLRRQLPSNAKHWGTARKAMNLFLRDILYHRYLSQYYKFNWIESWLEVPLDKSVADGISRSSLDVVPRWRGIIHLSVDDSLQFQRAARKVAKATGIEPVHLDVYWWRDVGINNIKNTCLLRQPKYAIFKK
jgi:hypothetical protein